MNQIFDTEDKFVSISRPRRFGKSMAAKMLVAYYSCGCDSYELFQNYEIAERDSFQQNLNKYDVIRLDMQLYIPNEEIREEFIRAVRNSGWEKIVKILPIFFG